MTEAKFLICENCNNLVGVINDAGIPIMCCKNKMTRLEPGTVEASSEKHIPVVKVIDKKVEIEIGTVSHPMAEDHSILWVYLQTDRGGQRKRLKTGDEPSVVFSLADEKPVAVYAYCNLHGLWKENLTE